MRRGRFCDSAGPTRVRPGLDRRPEPEAVPAVVGDGPPDRPAPRAEGSSGWREPSPAGAVRGRASPIRLARSTSGPGEQPILQPLRGTPGASAAEEEMVQVGFHTYRHSFASNLAARGVDQRIIDEWMGHQTEAMRKRYRHLSRRSGDRPWRSSFARLGVERSAGGDGVTRRWVTRTTNSRLIRTFEPIVCVAPDDDLVNGVASGSVCRTNAIKIWSASPPNRSRVDTGRDLGGRRTRSRDGEAWFGPSIAIGIATHLNVRRGHTTDLPVMLEHRPPRPEAVAAGSVG